MDARSQGCFHWSLLSFVLSSTYTIPAHNWHGTRWHVSIGQLPLPWFVSNRRGLTVSEVLLLGALRVLIGAPCMSIFFSCVVHAIHADNTQCTVPPPDGIRVPLRSSRFRNTRQDTTSLLPKQFWFLYLYCTHGSPSPVCCLLCVNECHDDDWKYQGSVLWVFWIWS